MPDPLTQSTDSRQAALPSQTTEDRWRIRDTGYG